VGKIAREALMRILSQNLVDPAKAQRASLAAASVGNRIADAQAESKRDYCFQEVFQSKTA